jgi:nitrite reductase/ring-hydroxylating ferredoxin subunit
MMTDGQWVPVALSGSIEPSSSAGAVIDGAEIVVWRDTRGVAHVWEDRCPHRGMRMSFGFVRGDHIACLYHGWEYDTAGQCRYIPAHPDLEVPQTIKVRTYVAQEAHGLIWTRLAETADAANPPDLGPATAVKSLYVAIGIDDLGAALARLNPTGTEEVAAGCWRLSASGMTLLLAAQPVRPGRVGLHVLMAGAAGPADCIAAARWAEGLRLALERPELAGVPLEFA